MSISLNRLNCNTSFSTYKLIIMNKLTQAEIDELAKDSDEEQEPQYSQDF